MAEDMPYHSYTANIHEKDDLTFSTEKDTMISSLFKLTTLIFGLVMISIKFIINTYQPDDNY